MNTIVSRKINLYNLKNSWSTKYKKLIYGRKCHWPKVYYLVGGLAGRHNNLFAMDALLHLEFDEDRFSETLGSAVVLEESWRLWQVQYEKSIIYNSKK